MNITRYDLKYIFFYERSKIHVNKNSILLRELQNKFSNYVEFF